MADSRITVAREQAEPRVLATGYRVRTTPGARKWARPDLDWRPSGYQPDAPTRLSYGPARPPNLMNRLKRSPRTARIHNSSRPSGPPDSCHESFSSRE